MNGSKSIDRRYSYAKRWKRDDQGKILREMFSPEWWFYDRHLNEGATDMPIHIMVSRPEINGPDSK
jgi:hypothetical protein